MGNVELKENSFMYQELSEASSFASSFFLFYIYRVSVGIKGHFFFTILISVVPCIYDDLIIFLPKFSIKRNIILLPSSYNNEFLTLLYHHFQTSKSWTLLILVLFVALQFSLASTFAWLQFINYTNLETWRYITLTSCSMSTQNMLLH